MHALLRQYALYSSFPELFECFGLALYTLKPWVIIPTPKAGGSGRNGRGPSLNFLLIFFHFLSAAEFVGYGVIYTGFWAFELSFLALSNVKNWHTFFIMFRRTTKFLWLDLVVRATPSVISPVYDLRWWRLPTCHSWLCTKARRRDQDHKLPMNTIKVFHM